MMSFQFSVTTSYSPSVSPNNSERQVLPSNLRSGADKSSKVFTETTTHSPQAKNEHAEKKKREIITKQTEAKESEADQNEREFYIKTIMETKNVSREVAEAEYDAFS